jgi:hypothetical protein
MKVIGLSALLVVSSLPAGVHAQSDMRGTYTLNRAASDDVNRLIDAATASMNPLTRSIARSRLHKTTPLVDTLTISFDGTTISVQPDRRAPITSPASGAVAQWTREDGQRFSLTTHWEGPVLVQTFRAADRTRENRFSLSPDGRTLTVNARLSSPRLPHPIDYKLVFKRTQ